jgi:two-component system chemotaxis response regulator CheY
MSQLIYVIDDDTALRTAYAAGLHKLGYEVETGVDGLEAQKLVAKAKPNLILLDMLMPNLDGIGFLKELRSDPANGAIKVVVVSNFESMPEASELDISKYISKLQYTPDAVAAKVDELLKAPA